MIQCLLLVHLGLYRVGNDKDLDGDGVNDKYLTAAATITANVTQANSLVTEIIAFTAAFYRYKIIDFVESGGNIYIKMYRWDPEAA